MTLRTTFLICWSADIADTTIECGTFTVVAFSLVKVPPPPRFSVLQKILSHISEVSQVF